MPASREYTIDELARAAYTTVRSVRVYHERGLLPPPEVRGRIGYYTQAHLHRLQSISRLLGQGMKLNGIRELLAAWDRGEGLADVLGIADASTTVSLSQDGRTDAETLQTLERLGSRRVRDLAVRMIQAGMPLNDTVDTVGKLRADCGRLAIDYAEMFHALSVGGDERATQSAAEAISDLVVESLDDATSPHQLS